jgi:hypothetical protein
MKAEKPAPQIPESSQDKEEPSLEYWAWEFLRRRDDYKASYKAYRKEAASYQRKNGQKWKNIKVAYDPPKKRTESESSWKRRCHDAGEIGRKLTLGGKYGMEWLLWDMHDPKNPHSKKIRFFKKPLTSPRMIKDYESLDDIIKVDEGSEAEDSPTLVSPDQCVLVFDLSQSLTPQHEKAWAILEEQQALCTKIVKETFRNRSKQFSIFIKILDTYNANPHISNIALGKLCGVRKGDKAYSDAGYKNLKRAQEIQEGYRAMVMGYYQEE